MNQKVKKIQTILECIDLRKKRVEELESMIKSEGFKNLYPIEYKNSVLKIKEYYQKCIVHLDVFLDMAICDLVKLQLETNQSTEIYTVVKNNLIN